MNTQSMRAAQSLYDDAEPDAGYPDPHDHPLLDEYLDAHDMTLKEFDRTVTDKQFFDWVYNKDQLDWVGNDI